MTQREAFLTSEGLSRLEVELWHLRTVRRQEVAQRIQGAKGVGGTVDNADYEEAKNEQAFVEGRILALRTMLASVAVIEKEDDGAAKVVHIGSEVVIQEDGASRESYVIVGAAEASPGQGRISNESPLGRALLGRSVGERISVSAPAGELTFKLVKIS